MKTNFFSWMLTAAMVLGLGLSVAACSDDDNSGTDGRSEEEIAQDPYNKESEAANALYRIVSQLSVCDSLPNDWQTATFEPRAGMVTDESQPRVRTITVNNAAEAVVRYNSLTGKNLPTNTTSDTYQVDGLGSLTLNVGGAGTVATIDVDVKQMPQLQQLRMVTAANVGENGSFKGEPYYSFGDVVKDKDGCYWICVRPAYSPNSKEDTHWMSFQLNPKDNIKEYTKSKCQPQKYPVNLGVQKEKMQYLAQLLAILANPEGYKAEAGKQGNYFGGGNNGLGGLEEAAMPVDSLIRQALLWKQKRVWEAIMPIGLDEDEADEFQGRFQMDVTFIYEKGSTSSYNLKIPTVTYSDADHFYRGEPTYATPAMDMKTVAFDVSGYVQYGLRPSPAYSVPDAFVVRYKTGFQLSSNWLFDPSPTKAIEGVTEIHRMKACGPVAEGESTTPPHYRLGDVYTDEEGSRWFCFWFAGMQKVDKSPYSYFVTFDNIKHSADKSRAINVPNKDLAMRATYILQLLFTQKIANADDHTIWMPAIRTLKEACGVDIQQLFHQHWDGVHGRYNFPMACVAYNGGTTTDQDLLRFVTNQLDYEENTAYFEVWTRYPWEPTVNDVAKEFRQEHILLQDIANDMLVERYATDRLAQMPMKYGMGLEDSTAPCQKRTQTDPRARDVTNYFYNPTTFANYTNPLSMWNEPVLFFRVTKVMDRGDNNYSRQTVDGHTLTLKQKANWVDAEGDDKWIGYVINVYYNQSEFFNEFNNNMIFNGVKTPMTSWKEDWY